MISFIVIGKNEGWKLSLCLAKVYETIQLNRLIAYEVIYVDSKSTDDSVTRVREYPEVKIIQLTSDCNAAIARNLGAKECNGDVLLFLDGDMELIPENFSFFYTKEKGIEYPFLSGDFDNYFYNQEWQLKSKDKGMMLDNDIFSSSVGGLFFISRELWTKFKGMNPKYVTGEDLEFALRLSKKGIKLLRRKNLLVHHHMIPYLNNKRKWKMLFTGKHLYAGALLYREHFFNKASWRRIIRNDYTAVVLFCCMFLFSFISLYPFVIYLVIVIFRVVTKRVDIISNLFFYMMRDISNILGFFLFFPKSPKVTYKVLGKTN